MGGEVEVRAIQGQDTEVDETTGQVFLEAQQVGDKEGPEPRQDCPTHHSNIGLLEQTPEDLVDSTERAQGGQDPQMSQTSALEIDKGCRVRV